MKVLVDLSQIPVTKAGVGVYAVNLIQEIAKSQIDLCCYVLLQDDDTSLDFISCDKVRLIKVKATVFRKFIFRVLLEQLYIPYLVLNLKIDVVHSLHYSFPLIAKCKKVVTICDMTFYKFPQLHVLTKVIYFKTFIALSSYFANKIICISESTKNDYISKFNSAINKTDVVCLACSEEFNPNIREDAIFSAKMKYGVEGDYFLFIGTIEPRKNISAIIIAFEQLSIVNHKYKLVIVGKKGWHYDEIFKLVQEHELNDKIIFTGFIDESEKPLLIAGATIFIYPSIYEGFGIPVLEALACGTPTITSNVSSMPEVAGNAALLVDPNNPQEIYKCIIRLLNDSVLYKELKNKSLQQASKFTWQKTAFETISIYMKSVYDK